MTNLKYFLNAPKQQYVMLFLTVKESKISFGGLVERKRLESGTLRERGGNTGHIMVIWLVGDSVSSVYSCQQSWHTISTL